MSKLLTKLYTEPEICPADPGPVDMRFENGKNKPWFIQFRYYNTATSKWELQTFKKGINYLKNYRDRLKAANALRDNILDQLERGWNPITNTYPTHQALNPLENSIAKLPFNAALRHALKECKIKESSIKEYRLTMNRMLEKSCAVESPMVNGDVCHIDIGSIPIGQIKKFHIKLLLEQCFRDFKWTDKSWNKHLGNLQGLLSKLVQNDVWEHNPAHDIRYLDVAESDKYQSLDSEDKRILREYIFLHHYGYFVYLMTLYHTGLRPFESLAVRIPDIKMDRRMIRIQPDRDRNNSKTDNIREVPINDHLFVLLKQWIVGYEDTDHYLFGSPYTSGRGNAGSSKGGLTGAMHPDYFKPSSVRIKRDTVTRLWKTLVREKLKIDHYQYDLKCTGGDDKIMAGVDMDALRDLYGHQNKRMTERYVKRLKEYYSNEIRKKSPAF